MEPVSKPHELSIERDKPEPPKSGGEIAERLGVKGDEGIQLVLFPEEVTDVRLTDEWEPWGKDGMSRGYGIICNWMSQIRLLDLMAPDDVKWWKVRDFAKKYGYDLVPVRWEGALEEIPEKYFELDTILGIRFYQHGPWFWPLSKPEIKEAPSKEAEEISEIIREDSLRR